jgi:glycosyltransferase involved in cell wall biosynthesis
MKVQNSAVSLVMPCYNEEDCLRQTASELVEAFKARHIPLQLVLVDNGSRDRTGEIIDTLIRCGLPITKVVVPFNRGYGLGVIEGLKQCTAPLVGYLCADGQVGPEGALMAYDIACQAGHPVLAKVRRRFRKDSWRRKLVSIAYNLGMPFVFGWLGSIDLNGNPKIMPRESMLAMQLQSTDWFLDPEVMIKAKQLGLKVVECQVAGKLRQGGKSNVRWVTCLEFMKNIVRYRWGRPLREWKKAPTGAAAAPVLAATGNLASVAADTQASRRVRP